jgi:hypothetical protein
MGGLIFFFATMLIVTSKKVDPVLRAAAMNEVGTWFVVSMLFWPMLATVSVLMVFVGIVRALKGKKHDANNS